MIRHRDCELGQHGGANCTGADEETSACNEHNCPGSSLLMNILIVGGGGLKADCFIFLASSQWPFF